MGGRARHPFPPRRPGRRFSWVARCRGRRYRTLAATALAVAGSGKRGPPPAATLLHSLGNFVRQICEARIATFMSQRSYRLVTIPTPRPGPAVSREQNVGIPAAGETDWSARRKQALSNVLTAGKSDCDSDRSVATVGKPNCSSHRRSPRWEGG